MPTDRSPSPTASTERAIRSVRSFSRQVWLDLVRGDQSERWRRGSGVPAETYFELLPELRENPEDALVLVGGEIVGTWRRANADVAVQSWRRLARAERAAVEAEAESLPLPGLERQIAVRWEEP